MIAQSVNAVEMQQNPLQHSEWIVIEKSLQIKKEKYLNDTILITALEPCIHCTGSIIKSRIRDVCYFLPSKSGDGISSLSIEMIYQLNHFPNLYLIPNEEIFSKFKTFFLDKR
ncbi:deaminase [Leptospira sp. GIMC2001]|uniref:deaminase n=1 Tax=Leptospira sp. GIMC2001 TaxID=1513297 RepID=UPI00234A8197|nr:deaminase [Leptospira sp. GIMC2001]WCL49502.1 deaminase [Leptospira sp. GIMC2001]